MISVKVNQLLLSNVGPVVLLKSTHDARSLPIFIGPSEAQAIAIRMEGIDAPRPMTHDLLKNALDFLECRLKRVEICDLVDGTFYASLVLEKDATEMKIDSRPSDAIALALRCSAPILVEDKVMDEAGREFPEADSPNTHDEVKNAHHHHEKRKLSKMEQLKGALGKAVDEERYEDAAKLRDEIEHLEKPHGHN